MQDLIDKIYFATGLSSCDIPSEVISYYLSEWQQVFPNNDCLVLHNTVVSLYEWLIKNSAKDATGGGSIREKEGNVEIEQKDYNKSQDWQQALDNYLDDPSSAFPSCRDQLNVTRGRVIFGGTSKQEVKRVRNYSDSFNQYDETSPYSPKQGRHCDNIGFSCPDDEDY